MIHFTQFVNKIIIEKQTLDRSDRKSKHRTGLVRKADFVAGLVWSADIRSGQVWSEKRTLCQVCYEKQTWYRSGLVAKADQKKQT